MTKKDKTLELHHFIITVTFFFFFLHTVVAISQVYMYTKCSCQPNAYREYLPKNVYQVYLSNKRAKMALYCSPDYQTSFESVGLSVQEKKFNIDFQDGSHLGFPIRIILALLTYKSSSYFQ